MIIGINTRIFLNSYTPAEQHFLQQLLIKTAAKYSLHSFILLGDKEFENGLTINTAAQPSIAGTPSASPVLRKYWYAIKTPSLLKKHKADLFISLDSLCTLSLGIPQSLFLPDPTTGSNKITRKKSLFLTRAYKIKVYNKAKSIITTSATAKENILDIFPVAPEKIIALHPAIDNAVKPISFEEKEELKDTFTGGKNYFLYTGEINADTKWLLLLKAFSVFKKRQKTEWKLVFTAKPESGYTEFIRRIESYKYRSEVILLPTLKEKQRNQLSGGAYAIVSPSPGEGFGLEVLQAMRQQIPVIAFSGGVTEERAGNAALYAATDSHTDLADKMMLLYKDESQHRKLVENASLRMQEFSWDKTVDLFWNQVIEPGVTQPELVP